jgi:hypothetical protein
MILLLASAVIGLVSSVIGLASAAGATKRGSDSGQAEHHARMPTRRVDLTITRQEVALFIVITQRCEPARPEHTDV